MRIGDYECVSPFVTAGSGNARWVRRQKERPEILSQTVFIAWYSPIQRSPHPKEHVLLRRNRCASFETRKLRLYDALRRVPEIYIVRVEDFFVHDGHYFAASQYLGKDYQTLSDYFSSELKIRAKLLLSLAECLKALHEVGIVHADLKPEHIVVEHDQGALRVRLIDFDSGFFETAPPETQNGMEIDPVYLSPEAFRMIAGKNVRLNRKLDSFALGILAHQLFTGEYPAVNKEKYSYLYAAVLDGATVKLSTELSGKQQTLIRKLLRNTPAFRPGDDRVIRTTKQLLL